MSINNSLFPNKASLAEIMRKINAFGHQPRVVIELDKFSYVPGLEHKYDVIEYVKEKTMKTISGYTPGDSGDDATPASSNVSDLPSMPIEGKKVFSDMKVISKFNEKTGRLKAHEGIDFDLKVGDPVVASWAGTVTKAEEVAGYGKVVYVDHGNGWETRYAYLSKISVQKGQKVNKGQEIGLGGTIPSVSLQGETPDAHLHFEIRKDGKAVNPEPYLTGTAFLNTRSGVSSAKAFKETTTEQVSYQSNYATGFDSLKYPTPIGKLFKVPTTLGTKTVLGFDKLEAGDKVSSFSFKHAWFKGGYLQADLFANLYNPGDTVKIKMDGKIVYKLTQSPETPRGVYHTSPIKVSAGNHTFTFSLENTKGIKNDPQQFGLISLKAVEQDKSYTEESVTSWDYEDELKKKDNWTPIGETTLSEKGDYIHFDDGTPKYNSGMERKDVSKFPMSVRTKLRVSADAHLTHFVLSGDNVKFNIRFEPQYVTDGGSGQYPVDNTTWQDYLLIAKDPKTLKVYLKKNGVWTDTGLAASAVPSTDNALRFVRDADGSGGMDISDVKYAFRNVFDGGIVDVDTSAPVEEAADMPVTVETESITQKRTPRLFELGGFVYDQTFYLEDDIMNWEIRDHMDMASVTSSITLSNHHGLYSPEYIRATIFPENKRNNPYTYLENGEIRHILSEYTPIRIYVGYGNELVRAFTGMIKGEIQEDSEKRTVTFNCVDRFDLLEEYVLLEEVSFPSADALKADQKPRPWIKSSIVQYLAVMGGMTGWRYNYEDTFHPDLVIEETYYTDVDQNSGTFMKFDEKGKLIEKSLADAKQLGGFMNPFVQNIYFMPGERLSDCIRKVTDEINFRTYCNRYGTFMMEHVDYENNMKWEFIDGENLYSLSGSSDFSRVRNHLQIVGSMGNVEHFFDRDLFIATKGHVRSAQIELEWIDETTGATARGAKKVVADKAFFDMKRQARTKNVVVKGNPFIEVLDGAWVYDQKTSTAGYYVIKGNTLRGSEDGMVNELELTWEEKVAY